MPISAWGWTVAILLGAGVGAAVAGDNAPNSEPFHIVERVLDDGRMIIRYKGGTYVGYTYAEPDRREPVWHGRCTFQFKTGSAFEGMCVDGRFRRGFLRSVDGRSVYFLDIGRSDLEAHRSATEKTGL